MNNVLVIEGRASANDLLEALNGEFLREAPMNIEKILQATAIAELQDRVIVGLGLDDLLHAHNVRTVDHVEEDDLAAQRQHALLPVFRLALARLIDPIIRCHLASILDAIHAEQPDGSLYS